MWGYFAAGGTGVLHKRDGLMRKEHYVEILKQHLKTMDNDSKHTAKLVTKELKDTVAITKP